MSKMRILTVEDFTSFGFKHLEELHSPLICESTFIKIVSKNEVYSLVFHSDNNELIICKSSSFNFFENINQIERLFKGYISTKVELIVLLSQLNIPTNE